MPMPKLPATVEAVVVPVTVRVPFTVVMSVMESPKVVLFSTEKVEAVVVERVTMPVVVRELEKTSPSASIRNLTEPLMAAAKRLLSAVAEAGFMMSAAPRGWPRLPRMPMRRKCGPELERGEARSRPAKVEVAVVDVAT